MTHIFHYKNNLSERKNNMTTVTFFQIEKIQTLTFGIKLGNINNTLNVHTILLLT